MESDTECSRDRFRESKQATESDTDKESAKSIDIELAYLANENNYSNVAVATKVESPHRTPNVFLTSAGRRSGCHPVTEVRSDLNYEWWHAPAAKSFEIGQRVYITNRITPLYNKKTEQDRKATVNNIDTHIAHTGRQVTEIYITTDNGRETT